jgi:hypothetical protein
MVGSHQYVQNCIKALGSLRTTAIQLWETTTAIAQHLGGRDRQSSVHLRPACSTKGVPGQPGLHKEPLPKQNNVTNRKQQQPPTPKMPTLLRLELRAPHHRTGFSLFFFFFFFLRQGFSVALAVLELTL